MPLVVPPFASVFGEIFDLVVRSGLFAKFIVLLLAALSVFSWAIMVQRARAFSNAERCNQQFWARFEAMRSGKSTMGEVAAWCEGQDGPLARVFHYFHSDFWPSYLKRRGSADKNEILFGILRRGVDRVGADFLEQIERPLGWLATFSSVAPFLGLLGTVWGIMSSFLQLGRQGSATLDVVGPGIAEALITTVCGLAVAIPSVMGYNALVRRARTQEAEVQRISSILADVVGDESLATSSSAAPATNPQIGV